jgi:hypothetical protein
MARLHRPLCLLAHACEVDHLCRRLGLSEEAVATTLERATAATAAAVLVSPHSARQRRARSATRRRRAFENCREIAAVACRQSEADRTGHSMTMARRAFGADGDDKAAGGTRAARPADMQWWRSPIDPYALNRISDCEMQGGLSPQKLRAMFSRYWCPACLQLVSVMRMSTKFE